MARIEAEQSSSSGLERFLFYSIPIAFTIVLTLVLLSVFGYDVKGKVLEVMQKTPVLNYFVNNPKDDEDVLLSQESESEQSEETEKSVADLEDLLAEKEHEITQLQFSNDQQQQLIEHLEGEVSRLLDQLTEKTITDEEYRKKIKEISDMYARMSPSKSAKIIQNLTFAEIILIMDQMKTDDRMRILEKMDPGTAANVSIQLKDTELVKDMEIAALQSRLALHQEDGEMDRALSNDELSQTIANMPADSAASMLLEMWKNDQSSKVVELLEQMIGESRSAILTAITKQSNEEAAKIVMRLGGSS